LAGDLPEQIEQMTGHADRRRHCRTPGRTGPHNIRPAPTKVWPFLEYAQACDRPASAPRQIGIGDIRRPAD
jgi:hypothetical protein